jgi:phosphinothricin acetyltransferase
MRQIRPAREGDAPALSAIYALSVVDSPISFELVPPSAEEMVRRLQAVRQTGPWLVCEEAGEVIGFAYGTRHRERAAYRWSADASVYLDADHRRMGVGSLLYRTLFEVLRRQGYKAAHAGITLPNAASVTLHERCGFRLVGVFPKVGWKLGRWHDVGWWQLELGEREEAPAELISPEAALRATLG